VRRVAGRQHDKPLEVEALDRRLRERDVADVRRIERASEQACHTHS
jgi:hypothetical protein